MERTPNDLWPGIVVKSPSSGSFLASITAIVLVLAFVAKLRA
jgi:hypothetical protein